MQTDVLISGIQRNNSHTSVVNASFGNCNNCCTSDSNLHEILGFKIAFIIWQSMGQESSIFLCSLQKALRDLLIFLLNNHPKLAQVQFLALFLCLF